MWHLAGGVSRGSACSRAELRRFHGSRRSRSGRRGRPTRSDRPAATGFAARSPSSLPLPHRARVCRGTRVCRPLSLCGSVQRPACSVQLRGHFSTRLDPGPGQWKHLAACPRWPCQGLTPAPQSLLPVCCQRTGGVHPESSAAPSGPPLHTSHVGSYIKPRTGENRASFGNAPRLAFSSSQDKGLPVFSRLGRARAPTPHSAHMESASASIVQAQSPCSPAASTSSFISSSRKAASSNVVLLLSASRMRRTAARVSVY